MHENFVLRVLLMSMDSMDTKSNHTLSSSDKGVKERKRGIKKLIITLKEISHTTIDNW